MLNLWGSSIAHSLRSAPFCQEIVFVVLLDSCPDTENEESKSRVHHDIFVEIFLCLVKHTSIVTGVDHVTPSVFGWVDVVLWHTNHTHLLEFPVALQPAHPMASRVSSHPSPAGTEPQIYRSTFEW